MKLFSIIAKALKKLKPLIDVIVQGRQAGWWDKGHGPQSGVKFLSDQGHSGSAEVAKVENGMSHLFAAFYTAAIAIGMSAFQGLDVSLLFSDPRQFAVSFLSAFLAGWSLYLQRPGQASVMLGSSKGLRAEAEKVSSLKLEVPISAEGGK